VVGLLFLPLLEAAGGWLRVLVGLLFEICIVDASIFVMRPVWPAWLVRVCCECVIVFRRRLFAPFPGGGWCRKADRLIL